MVSRTRTFLQWNQKTPDKRQTHGLFWCRQGNGAHHKCISNGIVIKISSKVHNLGWKTSCCLHQQNTDPCRTVILTNQERSTRHRVSSWEITCVLVWELLQAFSQIVRQFSWSFLTPDPSSSKNRSTIHQAIFHDILHENKNNPGPLQKTIYTFWQQMQSLKQWPWRNSKQQQSKTRPFSVFHLQLVRNQRWNRVDNLLTEYQDADQTELKLFRKVKDELTVSDESDVVLKNCLIIIPVTLQHKAVTLAHEGCQGLVKTKQLLREKLWFPGIDQWVKENNWDMSAVSSK